MRKLILLTGILLSVQLQAQYGETIRTGRPGQSIGGFTVGKNVLQLQQGFDFYQSRDHFDQSGENGHRLQEGMVMTNVIRFGLARKFEISAVVNYRWQSVFNQNSEKVSVGNPEKSRDFTALDFGGRYNILEGENGGPSWCIQARMGLQPTIENNLYPDIKVLTGLVQRLNKFSALVVNLGYVHGDIKNDRWNYTLNYTVNLGEKMGFIIENYGNYTPAASGKDNFQTYFDTGLWYLLNKDVQLDMLGGYGSNEFNNFSNENWFVGAGISWRNLFE